MNCSIGHIYKGRGIELNKKSAFIILTLNVEIHLLNVHFCTMTSTEVFTFLYFKGDALCKNCFYFAFEEEVHKTITDANLFVRGETVAIGASGGKGKLFIEHGPL